MKKYSSNEITALIGVSRARLVQYRTGREVKRNGKVEWKEAPLLDESDYEQIIENGRAKIYYYDTALQKIRSHQQKTTKKKVCRHLRGQI